MARWNFNFPPEAELFDLFSKLMRQNFKRQRDDDFDFNIDFSIGGNDHCGRRMNERSYELKLCQTTGLLS